MGLLEQMLAEAGVQPPTAPAVNAPVGEIPLANIGGFPRGTGPSVPVGPTVPPQQPEQKRPFKEVVSDFAGNFLFSLSQALKGSASAPGQRGTMLGVASALEAPMLQQQMQAQQAAERQKMAMEMEQLKIERERMQNDATNKSAMQQVAILEAATARMKERREAEEAERKAKEPRKRNTAVINGRLVDTDTNEVLQDFSEPRTEDLTFQEQTYNDYLKDTELTKKYGASRIGFEKWRQDVDRSKPDPVLQQIREMTLMSLRDQQSRGLNKDQLENAMKLSGQLKSHPAYTDMLDVANGIDGVTAGLQQENGFGDITAINAFQRMIDPGATVRSEDVVLIRSAASLLQKILTDYPIDKLRTGAKLPDAVRVQMKKMASDLYETRAKNYNDAVGTQYRGLAKAAGVPFELVGRDFPTKAAEAEIITTPDGKKWKQVGNKMVEQ